jgi:hypothetical protein
MATFTKFQPFVEALAEKGSFILTGINVILRPSNIWAEKTRSTTSWTEKTKNTTTFTEKTPSFTSWTEKDRS